MRSLILAAGTRLLDFKQMNKSTSFISASSESLSSFPGAVDSAQRVTLRKKSLSEALNSPSPSSQSSSLPGASIPLLLLQALRFSSGPECGFLQPSWLVLSHVSAGKQTAPVQHSILLFKYGRILQITARGERLLAEENRQIHERSAWFSPSALHPVHLNHWQVLLGTAGPQQLFKCIFRRSRVFISCKIGHELFGLTNVLQNMFFMFPNAGSKDKTETTLKEKVPQKIRMGEYLMHSWSLKQWTQQLKVIEQFS